MRPGVVLLTALVLCTALVLTGCAGKGRGLPLILSDDKDPTSTPWPREIVVVTSIPLPTLAPVPAVRPGTFPPTSEDVLPTPALLPAPALLPTPTLLPTLIAAPTPTPRGLPTPTPLPADFGTWELDENCLAIARSPGVKATECVDGFSASDVVDGAVAIVLHFTSDGPMGVRLEIVLEPPGSLLGVALGSLRPVCRPGRPCHQDVVFENFDDGRKVGGERGGFTSTGSRGRSEGRRGLFGWKGNTEWRSGVSGPARYWRHWGSGWCRRSQSPAQAG